QESPSWEAGRRAGQVEIWLRFAARLAARAYTGCPVLPESRQGLSLGDAVHFKPFGLEFFNRQVHHLGIVLLLIVGHEMDDADIGFDTLNLSSGVTTTS